MCTLEILCHYYHRAMMRGHLEDLTENRTKQYAEKIKEAFQSSTKTESIPRMHTLASPSAQRLREKHNLLLFSNLRKEQHLSELQVALQALTAANHHTSSDRDLMLSARSVELSTDSGPLIRLNFLKREACDLEAKAARELIEADQLMFVIKKTKEKIVHVRQRISQVARFKEKVLKDAPKATTLHAESLNDLTHSIYLLQQRKETQHKQRSKYDTQLKAQKELSQRAIGENEELISTMARSAVLIEENAERTHKMIKDLEENVRVQREKRVQLTRREAGALRFGQELGKLER